MSSCGLLLLLLPGSRALSLAGCRLFAPLPVVARGGVCFRAQLSENEWEELDGGDTVSDWDDEIAQMKAWQAAQAAKESGSAKVDATGAAWGGEVDESAYFDDPDDDAANSLLEEIAQRRAAAAAAKGGASPEASGDAASEVQYKRVLTAIEGVLNTMSRIEERMGRLEAKLDSMSSAKAEQLTESPAAEPPAEAAAPSAAAPAVEKKSDVGGWDGEVDEDAWFDDDPDEDLGDWRDVKRLEKLL